MTGSVLPLVGAGARVVVGGVVGVHAAGVDQAAAGEAEEAGAQGGDLLGEIFAQPWFLYVSRGISESLPRCLVHVNIQRLDRLPIDP